MKKEVMILILLGILLVSPLVFAQEQNQSQIYSGVDRFTDNVKLVFSGGDNKVRLALEIREKEIESAINNIQNQGEKKAIKNLERAKKKLQIVQEKVSLDTSGEIQTSVDEIIDKIDGEENLPDEFGDYILEEEKTQLTAELTEKTFEYCTELSKEDFALMLQEDECNPETAIPGLEKELEKLKDLQLRMFVQLMLEIRSCIDDPGTCNCEANVDVEQKAKCEKMVALALKCEYNEDEASCNELKSMEPKKRDNFAESFVPDYLMNLFREKEGKMIGYDIEPSCGVPEECWDENDKPECRQYDSFKETKEDWDEYGNFIGTKNKCGKEGSVPTMKESIPQCFDGDVFLEEKCGEITMVENEDGLINYLIGNEINGIIGDFENKSMQRIYAPGTSANGTMGVNGTMEYVMEIREGWMMVDNEWVVDEGARGIKKEMDMIEDKIAERTYAPGTGPNAIVRGNATGDDGLEWEVEGDVAGGSSDGESGVVVEGGENVVADDVAPEPDGIVEVADDNHIDEGDEEGPSCGDGVVCP